MQLASRLQSSCLLQLPALPAADVLQQAPSAGGPRLSSSSRAWSAAAASVRAAAWIAAGSCRASAGNCSRFRLQLVPVLLQRLQAGPGLLQLLGPLVGAGLLSARPARSARRAARASRRAPPAAARPPAASPAAAASACWQCCWVASSVLELAVRSRPLAARACSRSLASRSISACVSAPAALSLGLQAAVQRLLLGFKAA